MRNKMTNLRLYLKLYLNSIFTYDRIVNKKANYDIEIAEKIENELFSNCPADMAYYQVVDLLLRFLKKYKDSLDFIFNYYINYDPNIYHILNDLFLNYRRIHAFKSFRNIFNQILDDNKSIELAKKLEQSCFVTVEKHCRTQEQNIKSKWDDKFFCDFYAYKHGDIIERIHPQSITSKKYNNTIMKKIINNEIDVEVLAFAHIRVLIPKCMESEYNEIKIRSEVNTSVKTTDLYQCKKCKQKCVTYTERHFRGADEAPDLICKCQVCNYEFRIRS